MPTTSNFGWTTPADTDLVKDGAAAIRTLGNGIDTSFLDLKGGTTGQVLSKASNTDLDFSWVAQDDSNAIQNAIVDAKGDLISATAADTPARLAVGANGTVLTADSAEATGLKWAAPAGGLTLVKSTSFSAVSSVSVDNAFSATYENYIIIYEIDTATANMNIEMRLRVGGSDNSTASSYKSATFNMLDNGTTGNNNTTGATNWFVGTAKSTDAEWSRGELHIFKPFLAQRTNLLGMVIGVTGGGNLFSEYGNHGHNAATSFDGFTLLFSSGNVTGSVLTYGLGL